MKLKTGTIYVWQDRKRQFPKDLVIATSIKTFEDYRPNFNDVNDYVYYPEDETLIPACDIVKLFYGYEINTK